MEIKALGHTNLEEVCHDDALDTEENVPGL